MERRKRVRSTGVINHDDTKRQKRKIKTSINRSSKQNFTRFEDLSNEIIYEIFEFLDAFHSYQAFNNLNIRFRNFVTYSNLPLKINISSITRINFRDYYTNFIIPSQDRITSLYITNRFSYDLDISLHRILTKFIRLETLILENIDANYIDNILNDIISLSNLSSLVIITSDDVKDIKHHLLQIFRLPSLKYCKLSLHNSSYYSSKQLPLATNQNSPIQQLVIKHKIFTNEIHTLLSYVPQLRYLSLDNLHKSNSDKWEGAISSPHNLTHLYVKLNIICFDDFEIFIKTLFNSIVVLHFSATNTDEYFNAKRWEQLILFSMPCLRIFNIYISARNNQSEFDEFKSLFWLQREWFFDSSSSGYYYGTTFYSTSPYRRKEFRLQYSTNKQTDFDVKMKKNENAVHHVRILNKETMDNCIYYFPNANELSVDNFYGHNSNGMIDNLDHIISLKNLTKLNILLYPYSFGRLIQLLLTTVNLVTLQLPRIFIHSNDYQAIQLSETFRLVSNRNIIRNLILESANDMDEVELLLNLCPRIQCFEINKCYRHAASIVRLLTWKSHTNNPYLISISIIVHNDINYLERLKKLSHQGNLFNQFAVKVQSNRVDLWR
ncbi:unnamed protein product [Adineta steineri]|uniref:F-box domain-containing protein n=1 Tax=Adineta steineri TaxID=433720 RepID=A0A815J3P2_9BILA|nr:unnamed protein product [Adineta steineri]CAF1376717.1 unnamed protein product [Adineta steineri]CAF1568626.1 unnamed protein product [Adineta steineri]CAF1606066.1 unnamed protein product [Adineta steineri]